MNARAKTLSNISEQEEPNMDSNLLGSQKLTLTRTQILLGWGLISLMLVGVFLFGLYSGRQQGVELALVEQSTPRLRLPVEEQRGRGILAKPEAENAALNSEEKFDFSNTNDSFVVPENAQNGSEVSEGMPVDKSIEVKIDPSSGFVSKAANEVSLPMQEPIIQAIDRSIANCSSNSLCPKL